MTRKVVDGDVFFTLIPEDIDPAAMGRKYGIEPTPHASMIAAMARIANEYIVRQYENLAVKPLSVTDIQSKWAFTDQVDEVEAFEVGDNCAECRHGIEACVQLLLSNPGRWVAMAELEYVVVWP